MTSDGGAAVALDRVLELTVLLGRDMTADLERRGLTESRTHLLWLLAEGPRTQRELAEGLDVAPRTVTGLVDGLVATGFVTREPHPRDGRAFWVTPTDAGREVLDALLAGRVELAGRLFDGFDDARLARLTDDLDAVLDRLRELMSA